MKIRQGNAFTILWTVIVNGGATKLSELENISIELKNPIGQTFYPTFKVNEDEVLEIATSTKYQQWTGMYHLSCVVDKNSRNVQFISVATVGTSQLVLAMNGMSAYEIAVAHEFEGAEQDWLESLHQPAKDAAEDIAEMQEQADAALADVIESREEITSLE